MCFSLLLMLREGSTADMQNACPLHPVLRSRTRKELQRPLVYLKIRTTCDKGNQGSTMQNLDDIQDDI